MVQATWKKLAATASIQRSSQTLAVIANQAYIYGGELRPREPVDADVHVCSIGLGQSYVSLHLNPSSPTTLRPLSSPEIIPDPPHRHPEPFHLTTLPHHALLPPTSRRRSMHCPPRQPLHLLRPRRHRHGAHAMAPIEENGSLWVLDPRASSWSQLNPKDPQTPFPVGRSYHAIATDGHGTIFLHAGCPEKGRLGDLWAFSVSARQWQELETAPDPARGGTSMAYLEGKLFRVNGFDGKTEQGGAVDVFDPARNSWRTVRYAADGVSGPAPRSVGCLLPVKVRGRWSLVTAFGESDPSNLGHQGAGKMLSDVWIFDVDDEVWAEVQIVGDERPAARGWFAADVVDDSIGSRIVVQGGLGESNERLDDIWMLHL